MKEIESIKEIIAVVGQARQMLAEGNIQAARTLLDLVELKLAGKILDIPT